MPVVVYPAKHAAEAVFTTMAVTTAAALLAESCPKDGAQSAGVVHSSFGAAGLGPAAAAVLPSGNGFVRAVVAAYSNHHHLVVRPEDVWFAVLAQVSAYVNAHAEEVRGEFVAHDGAREVQVSAGGSLADADVGRLARRLADELARHLRDPELRGWVEPDFSTTTAADRVAASVLVMGTLQRYFTYKIVLSCGLPSVTLLGCRDDWVRLRARLDRLPRLGPEPQSFAALLAPVLDGFVRSFDAPAAADVLDFWGRVAHRLSGGSGPSYLSGWITAFCFWADDGSALYRPPHGTHVQLDSLDPETPGCDLGGTLFHRVEIDDIPSAFVSVPVTVDDNGIMHKTRMVAGSVGMTASASAGPGVGPLDTLQPLSGWWMYELKHDDGQGEASEHHRWQGGY